MTVGAPAAAARRAPAGRVRTALIVAAYLALTVWWLWPLPLRLGSAAIYPTTKMAEVSADYDLITWALAWDTHALLTAPTKLFDANIFYPAPRSLAFSEHFLGYVPLFAPTFLVTGNAVLASNVLLFLTFPLCALAMYALARRFVGPGAAFVAGALFAFTGQRYANLYHLHQLGTFGMPLALLLTERWLERARARDAVLLGLTVAFQMLSSFYLAYAIVLLYAAYLPLALWRWRAALDRRRSVGLATALVAAALPFMLASIPYLELQRLGLIPSRGEQDLPVTLLPSLTRGRVDRYFTSGANGAVAFVLAAIGLLVGWRRRRYPRLIGAMAFVLGVLLAFGPQILVAGVTLWSPYALLIRWLPGFAAVRLPERMLVVSQLGLALLAALGVDELRRRTSAALAWPVALAALALVLATGPPHPPHTLHPRLVGAHLPKPYRWLAEHGGGGALLELPLAGSDVSGQRMLGSTVHWLPMIDGYSAYPPLSRNFLRRIADRLPNPGALQALVDSVDVTWIVVHLDELDGDARGIWERGAVPGLELVRRWDDALLFRVTLPPVDDRRALLVSTTRTLGGYPLAPVAEPCTGRLSALVLGGHGGVAAPGARLKLGVEVANASASAWPGFGFYPRYLVRFATTFRRGGEQVGGTATTLLWADIPPGQVVPVLTDVTVPKVPGSYQLEVGLVQDGRPLTACGLVPARLDVHVVARPTAAKRSR